MAENNNMKVKYKILKINIQKVKVSNIKIININLKIKKIFQSDMIK